MSITVATSTLETSWQEIDVVDFTAGTLSTISAMLQEVEDNIQRGTLSGTTTPSTTQVNRWLVYAKERLAAIKNFQEFKRYAYCDTVQAQYEYGLPPDFRGGHVILRDITSDKVPRVIDIWDSAAFDINYADPSYWDTSRPDRCCIRGRKLILYPVPDAVYRYELQYNRSGDDQTATDVSWLPELYRDFCVEYATYRAFRMLKEFDAAQVYYRDWMDDLKLARVSDGKHKWASTKFICATWQ